jgi:flagellar basal body-associated protein FliL
LASHLIHKSYQTDSPSFKASGPWHAHCFNNPKRKTTYGATVMADETKDERIESWMSEFRIEEPRKGNMFLLLGIGSLLGVLAVVVGIFLFAPGLISEEGAKGQGHVYSMEPFLVNLAVPDQVRYLKVKIAIESTERKPDEEYQQRLSQLRDSILTVLSAKRYQDIFDSEGKRKLKEEIISKLNPLVSHFKVKAVYFTEFVVQ